LGSLRRAIPIPQPTTGALIVAPSSPTTSGVMATTSEGIPLSVLYATLAAEQAHAEALRRLAALPSSTPKSRGAASPSVDVNNYAVTLQRASHEFMASLLHREGSRQHEWYHDHRYSGGTYQEMTLDGKIETKVRAPLTPPPFMTSVPIAAKLMNHESVQSLSNVVDALVADLLPGVLRLTVAGSSNKSASPVITPGIVLSALSLRSDHPWNGAQPLGFTPTSDQFQAPLNEHDQVVAIAHRLLVSNAPLLSSSSAPSVSPVGAGGLTKLSVLGGASSSSSSTSLTPLTTGTKSSGYGTRDAIYQPSIPVLESMIMDQLPSLQSTVER
jgi:hypothetical protein